MNNAKREFNDRVGEVNKYFTFLEDVLEKEALLLLPNGNLKKRIDVELTAILKSNLILLLYNLIEATVTNCLMAIHNSICNGNCKFSELSEELKSIFIDYYFKNINSNKLNEENLALHLKAMINIWAYNDIVSLSYDEYTKFKTGNTFSGNLDSKEIRKIAKKYGVEFDLECSEIRKIRDCRNKLAHGEITFIECCNLFTPQYIRNLKEKTINHMDNFVLAIEDFVNNKKYKI